MTTERLDRNEISAALAAALQERDSARLRGLLQQIQPDDAVGILDDLSTEDLEAAATHLGDENLANILAYVDPGSAARILVRLHRALAADVLEKMEPDDATDIIEELDPVEAEAILIEMTQREARDIRDLLVYPPDSAGGRMTPEAVTVHPNLTTEEAIAAIKRVAEEAETIYYVYVTEDDGKLVGVLSLRDLVLARPRTPISQVTVRDPVKVRADEDQEVAARILAERGYLAIPVVDEQDRLLGIITADDVAGILEQEATEDIERLGGSQPLEEPYLHTGITTLVQKRVVWLLVLFVGGAITSDVLSYFEEVLSQVIALMFFVPLLIGIGGNVGSQIVTTLVRAMAVGDVEFHDLTRVLGKEMLTAMLVGTIMAGAAALRAWTLGVGMQVAFVVAVAAAFIVLWAASVGAVLPLILRRIGVDPAVVSAPLISTLVDGTGLFLYLTVARLLLGI